MNHYYLKPKIAEYRPFVQNRFSKKEQESTEYSIVRFLKICDIFPNFVNKLATALTTKYVKQNGKIELVEMFDSDHYIFDNRIKNKDSIYYKTLKFIYNLINFKDIIYLYTDSIDNYLKELINFGETEKIIYCYQH